MMGNTCKCYDYHRKHYCTTSEIYSVHTQGLLRPNYYPDIYVCRLCDSDDNIEPMIY